jgi:hypothetical protein
VTPTIADHSTHRLLTAVHLAAQIADRVLQLLGHVAGDDSGADDDDGRIGSSVPCRQGDRVSLRLASSSLRSYDCV